MDCRAAQPRRRVPSPFGAGGHCTSGSRLRPPPRDSPRWWLWRLKCCSLAQRRWHAWFCTPSSPWRAAWRGASRRHVLSFSRRRVDTTQSIKGLVPCRGEKTLVCQPRYQPRRDAKNVTEASELFSTHVPLLRHRKMCDLRRCEGCVWAAPRTPRQSSRFPARAYSHRV